MKEWLNSSCRITISNELTNKKLFFNVKQVLSITDSHITFIDRFNEVYTFNRRFVEEIQPYKVERERMP